MVWKQEPKSWEATKTWSEPWDRSQNGYWVDIKLMAEATRERAWPIAGKPLTVLKLQET